MPYTLQLRTNSGCTALLVLSGDQTVVEVSDRQGLVSIDNRYGFRPLSCHRCASLGRSCATHNSARPWLPLELVAAVRAASTGGRL